MLRAAQENALDVYELRELRTAQISKGQLTRMIRTVRRLLPTLTLAVAGLVVSGCVAVVPHTAKTTVVSEIGAEAANVRLNAVMIQSTNPRIVGAKVEGGVLTVKANQVIIGAFWQSTEVTHEKALPLTKVRVHENGVIYIFQNGVNFLQASLPTPALGTEVADILMSFKAGG